jgi:stage III sporulation protein AG
MDMESGKEQIIRSVKKYQYVLWVVLLGIFLMLLPQKQESPGREIPAETEAALTLEEELSAMLSKISGVGKAEVLLTELSGSSTIYQTDTTQNQGNSDTVIVMDRNREEQGLVKQVLPPVYKGALVVCQGADSASVRLSVVDAVKSVTGLSSDCITVLKMK